LLRFETPRPTSRAFRGATQKAASPQRGGGIRSWGDPWRAANPSQPPSSRTGTLSASEDPLCLSQGMTYGPLRRETLSVSPCEGEDLFPDVGETQAHASLPSIGETKRGLALHRRGPVPGGWRIPGPCASLQRMTYGPLRARPLLSLPARERTCFRRLRETPALASLRFVGENNRGLATPGCCDSPHRGTDPRCAAEHRSPAGFPHNPWYPHHPSGTHEHRKAKPDAGLVIRGHAGGEAGAGARYSENFSKHRGSHE